MASWATQGSNLIATQATTPNINPTFCQSAVVALAIGIQANRHREEASKNGIPQPILSVVRYHHIERNNVTPDLNLLFRHFCCAECKCSPAHREANLGRKRRNVQGIPAPPAHQSVYLLWLSQILRVRQMQHPCDRHDLVNS